ncbi:hypothetical protein [Streptomyces sp. LN785]|uniref:hypothetical protein n=1 Tax=Streptomyces sp. LN785 TaxID=3112983 RepID=UPI0037249685
MRSADCALLACDVSVEDEDLDPMYYQELIHAPPPRESRTRVPRLRAPMGVGGQLPKPDRHQMLGKVLGQS